MPLLVGLTQRCGLCHVLEACIIPRVFFPYSLSPMNGCLGKKERQKLIHDGDQRLVRSYGNDGLTETSPTSTQVDNYRPRRDARHQCSAPEELARNSFRPLIPPFGLFGADSPTFLYRNLFFLSFSSCPAALFRFSPLPRLVYPPNSVRQKNPHYLHTRSTPFFSRLAEVHVTEGKPRKPKKKTPGPCYNPSTSSVSARSLDAVRCASARWLHCLLSSWTRGPLESFPFAFYIL